jgi:hypothetical protein
MTLAQIKKNERQVMLNGIDQIQNATEMADVNFMPSVLGTLLSNFDQYQARYIEPDNKRMQETLEVLNILKRGANVLSAQFIQAATISVAAYLNTLADNDDVPTREEREENRKEIERYDAQLKEREQRRADAVDALYGLAYDAMASLTQADQDDVLTGLSDLQAELVDFREQFDTSYTNSELENLDAFITDLSERVAGTTTANKGIIVAQLGEYSYKRYANIQDWKTALLAQIEALTPITE